MVTGVIAASPVDAPRRGHFGAWRALSAGPAIVGSLLLLLVLLSWMGQWEGLVPLGWAASGPATFTRAGERVAVAVGCGFRRPRPAQQEALDPVWVAAVARAGIDPAGVELYVQRRAELNAYAVGGRSVAVTSGVVRAFLARRLGSSEMEAVLIHDPLTAPTSGMACNAPRRGCWLAHETRRVTGSIPPILSSPAALVSSDRTECRWGRWPKGWRRVMCMRWWCRTSVPCTRRTVRR
jgi:hypothetical protein